MAVFILLSFIKFIPVYDVIGEDNEKITLLEFVLYGKYHNFKKP
jgi:hypothetical protein